MILIADSGATKIQWVVINEGRVSDPIETSGFNPYFMESKILEQILDKELVPFVNQEYIRQVFYYGAGCSTQQKCGIVDDAIRNVFVRADIEIYHDIFGAARALFGNEPGIACILGTGSNCCFYDGRQIAEYHGSLGFLFGDEGSGAYLGKLFLTDYLKDRIPNELKKAFEDKFNFTLENILDAVYNKPHPNRFLSSFAMFLGEYITNQYVKELIKRNFEDFMVEQVETYPQHKDHPVAVVGSVGFHFSDIFRKCASEHHLKVSKIIQTPIEGLVEYHMGNK